MIEQDVRVLVVEGLFYPDIQQELRKGATRALQAAGAGFDVVGVPGAFEIPAAIALSAVGT